MLQSSIMQSLANGPNNEFSLELNSNDMNINLTNKYYSLCI